MISYQDAIKRLRNMSRNGNLIAGQYLYLLEGCEKDERDEMLRQIESFVAAFQDATNKQIGPSEYKGSSNG